jgi:hypothetical protein
LIVLVALDDGKSDVRSIAMGVRLAGFPSLLTATKSVPEMAGAEEDVIRMRVIWERRR